MHEQVKISKDKQFRFPKWQKSQEYCLSSIRSTTTSVVYYMISSTVYAVGGNFKLEDEICIFSIWRQGFKLAVVRGPRPPTFELVTSHARRAFHSETTISQLQQSQFHLKENKKQLCKPFRQSLQINDLKTYFNHYYS